MPYCINCGQQVRDEAKFCDNCGSALYNQKSQNGSVRQQEYAGNVKKCPACGEEIPSFTAICPSCGHEINSSHVGSSIKDFANRLSQADLNIANSPASPKTGWKSWSGKKKFGWIILNLFTMCLPLLLYFLVPLLGIGKIASFTSEEKKKVSIINNYTFPNDRESILEALLFIKSQVSMLSSDKIDRNTLRWVSIWKSKATLLFEKAEYMFPGDTIANKAYSSVLKSEHAVKKSLLIRLIIAVILVCMFATFFFVRSDVGNSINESKKTFEWPNSGIALQIPEPLLNTGKINYNYDNDLSLVVKGINQSQFEEYIEACKDVGFTVEGEKNNNSYGAYNKEGYRLHLFYASSDLDIHVQAPEQMENIQWPKSNIAKRVPTPKSSYGRIHNETEHSFTIHLGNISKQEYKEYIDSVMDAGFTVDYKRSDDHFRASDKDGYSVVIDYLGNNVILVKIAEPNQ